MSFALVCFESPPVEHVKVFVDRMLTWQTGKFVKSTERKGTCRVAQVAAPRGCIVRRSANLRAVPLKILIPHLRESKS